MMVTGIKNRIGKLLSWIPLFAYISADRIGHQSWETALHCAYANKKERPLIIFYSHKTTNRLFNLLNRKGTSFVYADWIFKILNSRLSGYVVRCFYKLIRLPLKGILKIRHKRRECIQNGSTKKTDGESCRHLPAGGECGRFSNDFAGIIFDESLRMFPFLKSMPVIDTAERYLDFGLVTKYFKPVHIEQKRKTEDLLRKLGLSNADWFVCLHVRESSFLGDTFREWRNQDVDRYLKAVRYIVKLGGYVVRMGEASMKKMPKMENVIDYAHSKYRSDFADICLSGKARFAIVNNSGYRCLPQLFGVPLLNVNVYPVTPMDCYQKSLIIFKKVYSTTSGKNLKLKEVLKTPMVGYYNTDEEYKNAGLKICQNSEDEILDAVKEMVQIGSDDTWEELSDEQILFQSEIKKSLKESPYFNDVRTHIFYPDGFCRIGSNYMRENWD